MKRRYARWLVALWVAGGLALLTIMTIVILPPLLSADYHRAAIEVLASRLTGRQVIIKGPIRLSMVPAPQLDAADIRIDVPHGEHISAASLRLDLAPRALLLGRLRATRLTLHAPRVVIPWPLPDGAASILPPPWLATLHARIEDGTIILGRLVLRHADLAIFTGGGKGVLTASGTGTILGAPVSASLNLAGLDSQGLTPVSANIVTPISALAQQSAALSFSGTVNAQSVLTGRLAGSALASTAQSLRLGHTLPAAPVRFTAKASASRRMINLTAMNLTAGPAALQGTAAIDLTTGIPSLVIQGHDIDTTPLLRLFDAGPQDEAMNLRADLNSVRLGGFAFTRLKADLRATANGTAIHAFSAALPGQGRLDLAGTMNRNGLRGTFTLDDQAPAALIAAIATQAPAFSRLPPLQAPLHLAGSVRASADHHDSTIRLGALHGDIGGNSAALSTGAVVARLTWPVKLLRLDIAASLGFARLDAAPLLDLIKAPPSKIQNLGLDVALTARRAQIGATDARNLLLDARLGEGLTIRALDFYAMTPQNKPAALVAMRGARSNAGTIAEASLVAAGPDAAQALAGLPQAGMLAGALLKALRAPALLKTQFAARLTASGPPTALASRLVANLGDMRIRAEPRFDLANNTASGPVSFRMPSAITLMKPWDKEAGLAWPGPGSAGLRADFTFAPRHVGLSNFVLSFGALTASGRLALDYAAKPYRLAGVINADTLALPPPAALLRLAGMPDRLALQLPNISAAHILLGGTPVADDAQAALTATPQAMTLKIGHAGLADGVLTGQTVLNAPAGSAPPLLKTDLKLADADAARLTPAFAAAGFPQPVSAGRLTVTLNTQASGYAAKTWAATLGGTMTASGTTLTVQGIDLHAATALLGNGATPDAAKLRQALFSGTTDFTALTLDGNFASGAFTIGKGRLDGAAGSADLAGTVDVPDRSLAATVTLQPVQPGSQNPTALKIALSGPWAKLKHIVNQIPEPSAMP